MRADLDISIHTPLAGSDVNYLGIDNSTTEFQSTLPLRGVTINATEQIVSGDIISIHTPLAGSD